MDFRNRGAGAPSTSSTSSAPGSFSSSSSTNGGNGGGMFKNVGNSKWLPLLSVVLLISVAVMLVLLSLYTYVGGPSQSNAIKKDKYQAVFLNNGQVYFGHIKELNRSYVNLGNIYYLQTNNSSSTDQSASSTPTNVTLVKLGCELHGPYDQMIINDSQVLFWENLQDSSQVVSKIKEAQKSNPNNTCTAASQSSTQQAPSNSAATQPTTSTGTGSTGTSTTTKKP